MTEEEARAWLEAHVPRETIPTLTALVAIVLDEMGRQNLISASTADHIWARHIVDSAQLLRLAPHDVATWIDLGSGAGFPGLVIAAISPGLIMTLVEVRRKRIDFLETTAARLGLSNRVRVAGSKLEMVESLRHDVISARAFAPIERLLALAHRFSDAETKWLLPKGKSAASELEAARASWQGSFRIEPSITDSEAAIIVAEQVQPRARGARRR